MRVRIYPVWVITGLMMSVICAANADRGSGSEFPRIMAEVRARMPLDPILITGRLLSARRVGRLEHDANVEILLLHGGDRPRARYTISDILGEPVERMTIIRCPDGTDFEIKYEKGSPLSEAPAPDLGGEIRGTGITWNELTLSFLWRTDGRVKGFEQRRGRDCVILEFGSRDQQGVSRIWIDENIFMILQAEEYDAKGERSRRLSIRNIRKIGDTWMVKDMEVRRYPSLDRTILRIDDILHLNEDP